MVEDSALLISGLAAALTIGTIGYLRRALSPDGAVLAVLVGTVVVVAGGWWWGLLLIAFFASSSVLSQIGGGRERPGQSITRRGSRRDAVQVAANGGVAALLALLGGFSTAPALFFAYAGAVAAVTADTWATELGTRSRTPPRLIVSGRTVPPGTSGAISLAGTLGAGAGALLIAGLAAVGAGLGWVGAGLSAVDVVIVITLAGIAGSLVDSLLGATLQAAYRCPVCEVMTEQLLHHCGTPTLLVQGRPAIDNDVVNALASAAGASVGALMGWVAMEGQVLAPWPTLLLFARYAGLPAHMRSRGVASVPMTGESTADRRWTTDVQ